MSTRQHHRIISLLQEGIFCTRFSDVHILEILHKLDLFYSDYTRQVHRMLGTFDATRHEY